MEALADHGVGQENEPMFLPTVPWSVTAPVRSSRTPVLTGLVRFLLPSSGLPSSSVVVALSVMIKHRDQGDSLKGGFTGLMGHRAAVTRQQEADIAAADA